MTHHETLSEKIPPADLAENLIVFDADCIVCSGFCPFHGQTHDRKTGFRFVSATSETGRRLYERFRLDPDLLETNIVLLDGRAYTKMASFAVAMKSAGWPWALLSVVDFLPRPLADWLYDRIARKQVCIRQEVMPPASAGIEGPAH